VIVLILDGDIFTASEVALEIDDFQVLDIEVKEVGLLCVDNCIPFSNLDSGVELSDLFLIQLHFSKIYY
jgi:hypothetical protein